MGRVKIVRVLREEGAGRESCGGVIIVEVPHGGGLGWGLVGTGRGGIGYNCGGASVGKGRGVGEGARTGRRGAGLL